MGPEETPATGTVSMEIGEIVLPMWRLEARADGVCPMKFSELVAPVGFEGSPPNDVILIGIRKVFIPLDRSSFLFARLLAAEIGQIF